MTKRTKRKGKLINIKIRLTGVQYEYLQKLSKLDKVTERKFIRDCIIEMIGSLAEAVYQEEDGVRDRIEGRKR